MVASVWTLDLQHVVYVLNTQVVGCINHSRHLLVHYSSDQYMKWFLCTVAHFLCLQKLMKEESVVAEATEADDEEEIEGTIPALEVAARYQQLMNKHIALPAKRVPFRSKTEPRPKKFLKPSLD